MRDRSSAHVARTGSGLGILPAISGGIATQPRAPGPNVPLAITASASRHDRLSAAQPVSEHNRSGATLAAASAPDHSPVSLPPAAGHDRSRRVPVAAGSPSASVIQSSTQEGTVYDRMFTAAKLQALAPTSDTPVLAAEVRLLQMLIYRLLAWGPAPSRPRNRRRGAAVRRRPRTVLLQQIAAIPRSAGSIAEPRRRRPNSPLQMLERGRG